MRLLDSNILIHAVEPAHQFLQPFLFSPHTRISALSIPEVLGYRGLTAASEQEFRAMFERLRILDISRDILYRTAGLRRLRRIKISDAIIAATALEYGYELVSRNERDFRNIPGLVTLNPFNQL